jgi:hypothetical protein
MFSKHFSCSLAKIESTFVYVLPAIDSPLLDVLYRETELEDVCPMFAARQLILLGYYPNIDYNKLTNYIGSAHLCT